MIHIKQNTDGIYTIVNVDGWGKPLEEHPSIIDHPELFEIVDADIPENFQILNYE